MTDLKTARARLAEAEADLAAGINPYAAQNLATHRARVARLEAAATASTSAAPVAPSTAVLPAPAALPTPKALPVPTGTREDRLRRLATGMDADEATLAKAIADGTSPDEFAMIALHEREVTARVREIVEA